MAEDNEVRRLQQEELFGVTDLPLCEFYGYVTLDQGVTQMLNWCNNRVHITIASFTSPPIRVSDDDHHSGASVPFDSITDALPYLRERLAFPSERRGSWVEQPVKMFMT